jgi:phospholipid/cholesterol/gamma-HCH transport system ATP-binding protein
MDAVLEFQEVAVDGGHPYDTSIWQVTFSLMRGDLLLIYLEPGHLHTPLADAAQGLVEPSQGRVRYLGCDWRQRTDRQANEARASIGRLYSEPGWLSDLDMEENITLAQRHHTHRPESEIRDEASELALLFSLPGLPSGPSTSMRRQDLRGAACVRALLGKPTLLILERPTASVYPTIMPALMTSIGVARSRGSAVLWTTADREVWNDPGIRPTARASMSGSQLCLIS